jgi:hypothetical protein
MLFVEKEARVKLEIFFPKLLTYLSFGILHNSRVTKCAIVIVNTVGILIVLTLYRNTHLVRVSAGSRFPPDSTA